MKSWLEKLERKAGYLLDMMDHQLQEPIVQAMTGEVFTHGSETTYHTREEQPAPAKPKRTAETARKRSSADSEALCPPALQQANAKL